MDKWSTVSQTISILVSSIPIMAKCQIKFSTLGKNKYQYGKFTKELYVNSWKERKNLVRETKGRKKIANKRVVKKERRE